MLSEPPTDSIRVKRSFRFWQTSTIASLFIGYSGYYVCRSNLSVATPLILDEFAAQGMNKEVIGQIASVGVVFYAIGKVVNGVLGDFLGGKKIFIAGMIGSVAATVIFGISSGVGVFFAVWAANRLIQSMGWGGLVKTAANWVGFRSYGKVMALLSLSFLFGDVVARLLLGALYEAGIGWRQLFFVAAAILAVITVINVFFLKENPETVGFTKPEVNPENLFNQSAGAEAKPASLRELLLPYFKSFPFLLLLIVSFGLTAIREAFNFWLPTYLTESTQLSGGDASAFSALFPAAGVVSILLSGYLSDLSGKRGLIILLACLPAVGVLLLMTLPVQNPLLPLVFIALVGLLILGPYSFLAGAMSLDIGGRKGAATAAGLMDAIGYVGGTLAVWLTGVLAQRSGWNSAFMVLAATAALTAVAAFVYYITQESRSKKPEV